jgi:hypothetical protein
MPERICPRCGRGMVSGWQFPGCANYGPDLRDNAHALFCTHFADRVCDPCLKAIQSA